MVVSATYCKKESKINYPQMNQYADGSTYIWSGKNQQTISTNFSGGMFSSNGNCGFCYLLYGKCQTSGTIMSLNECDSPFVGYWKVGEPSANSSDVAFTSGDKTGFRLVVSCE